MKDSDTSYKNEYNDISSYFAKTCDKYSCVTLLQVGIKTFRVDTNYAFRVVTNNNALRVDRNKA